MTNRHPRLVLAAALAPWLLLGTGHAQQPVTGDASVYYEIGGAEPVSGALNPNIVAIPFTASASLRMPNSCTSLDPMISLTNGLDDIKDGIDQAESSMVLAANNAIAALPSIVLQRALPGVYDHFQNALASVDARVRIATKSCQAMVEDAANGTGGFRDWVKVSRTNFMSQQLVAGGTGPIEAVDAVDTTSGDAGIETPGGPKGGAGQPPLSVTQELVQAGYNSNLSQPIAQTTAPVTPGPAPRLVELWADPPAAASWAQQVVGEKTIRTCQGCDAETTPGTGLIPRFEEEKTTLTPLVTDLISGATVANAANRRAASASNIVLTTQLIAAVRGIPDPQERALFTGRLISDIAVARTVERALATRRMILSGGKVPELSAIEPVQEEAAELVAVLEQEIEGFLFEDQVKEQLVSQTANIALERAANRRSRALVSQTAPASNTNTLRSGAVN